MICEPCGMAGDLLTEYKSLPSPFKPRLDEIRLWHDQCEQPATCPCHHQVTLDALQTREETSNGGAP